MPKSVTPVLQFWSLLCKIVFHRQSQSRSQPDVRACSVSVVELRSTVKQQASPFHSNAYITAEPVGEPAFDQSVKGAEIITVPLSDTTKALCVYVLVMETSAGG